MTSKLLTKNKISNFTDLQRKIGILPKDFNIIAVIRTFIFLNTLNFKQFFEILTLMILTNILRSVFFPAFYFLSSKNSPQDFPIKIIVCFLFHLLFIHFPRYTKPLCMFYKSITVGLVIQGFIRFIMFLLFADILFLFG